MLKTIKDMLEMLKSRSKQLRFSIALSVVENMLMVVPLMMAFCIIAAIPELNPGVSTPLTNGAVIKYTVFMVACVLARIVIRYNIHRLRSGSGYEAMCLQRKVMGRELRKVSMGYFNQKSLGDLVSTITSDASYMELYGVGVLEKIVNAVLSTITGFIVLFVFDYRIAIVVFLLLIPVWFVFRWITSLQDKMDLNRQEEMGTLTENTIEYVRGLHVLKTYNMTGKSFFRIKVAFARFKDVMLRLELAHTVPVGVLQLCFRMITLAIILLSALFTLAGQMTFQSAAVLSLGSFSLFAALELMGSFGAFIRLAQLSTDRINSIKRIPKIDEQHARGGITGCDICVDHVSFAYDSKEVLRNISFSVPEKSMTALVGPSGSGKTTVVNLVSRFWDVSVGEVRIGGRNVKEIPYEILLENISFVFQDVFLFDDTVLNNIRIGRPGAGMDEVMDAARRAGCHDFICRMEQGYDTMVGEGGAMLSGGERQRISIARALIKDAPIVLLDEVTANVDPENERQIQKALQELLKDRTVIMIAHKLSTIRHVDQILVIQDGGIIQRGAHQELVNKEGIYKKLWDMQYQTSKWKI